MLETAMRPVAQSFQYFYDTYGPDPAEALLASLINFKRGLDRNGEPLQ
jgi:hypothetical protein